MRHKLSLFKHVTALPFSQVRVKMMTKISGFGHTDPKRSLWTERHVRPDNGIREAAANKTFNRLLTGVIAFQKKLPEEMVSGYAKMSSVIHFMLPTL